MFNHSTFLYSLVFTLSSLIFNFPVQALTPQEVLQKIDDIRAPTKQKTFIFHVKVTVRKADQASEAEFDVRVKEAKKSLVLFKSPPSNAGRVLLMVEDSMWIYIPGTRNPLRISPQQQIMGRVSNADVARVAYSIDYTADPIEEEVLDGSRVMRMSLVSKTKGAAYKKIDLWIEKDSFKPIKAEFYALSGLLLKTAFYKGYKEILGRERPTILEIHDAIKKGEITTMEYSDMKPEDTPDAYFQKTYMERVNN